MPKVGDRNFPYTSAGVRAAQLHAKNTGQQVQMMKKGGAKKPVLKYKKGGMKKTKKKKQEVDMNLLKDLWAHLKEWNDWKMKDWIKAGIVVVIVLVVLKIIILPGA